MGQEKLIFQTVPDTFVRHGFDRIPQPYQRVVDIVRDGAEGFRPASGFMDRPETRTVLCMADFASKVGSYWNDYFKSRRVRNCASFACHMAGIDASDWREALLLLKPYIVCANKVATSALPFGAVAVIGALQKIGSGWVPRTLHAFASMGGGHTVDVVALGGYLRLSDQESVYASIAREFRDRIGVNLTEPQIYTVPLS